MNLKNPTLESIQLSKNAPAIRLGGLAGLNVEISDNGLVQCLRHGNTLISRTTGDSAAGGLLRIYLRQHLADEIKVFQLVGPQGCLQSFGANGNRAQWQGSVGALKMCVTLTLNTRMSAWYWDIVCENSSDQSVDVDCIMAQDVGIADVGAITSNEAYVSHYVDTTVLECESAGSVLCYRQNLAQKGGYFPWLQLACLSGAGSYATDAFDFYGSGYRLTRTPKALKRVALLSRVRQFEFACGCLASSTVDLPAGQETRFEYAGMYLQNHPEATSESDLEHSRVLSASRVASRESDALYLSNIHAGSYFQTAPDYPSITCSKADLLARFPGEWRHIEEDSGGVLSFFTGENVHVVTAAKEAIVDRPHGSMLMGSDTPEWNDSTLATTMFMNGVFNAHTVVGNTSFHKMLSLPRDPLGMSRMAGQRIFVQEDGEWFLLGMPSFFEMARDCCRWYYLNGASTVIVEVSLQRSAPGLLLEVIGTGSPKCFLVSHELVLGADENSLDGNARINVETRSVEFGAEAGALGFAITVSDGSQMPVITGAEVLNATVDNLVVLSFSETTGFKLAISGAMEGSTAALSRAKAALQQTPKTEDTFWKPLNRGLELHHTKQAGIGRLNDALHWFSHNAMIHYASPHGLEQYSGAAWGTRDVCQGPLEYFLAVGQHGMSRHILLETFARQFKVTSDWPQWFMLDGYRHIAQEHSHGDIVVWPLKALAAYISITGDCKVLDEAVPFMSADFQPMEYESLERHVVAALDRIEGEFVAGTALIRYGHGDWDDSLQPADPALPKRLVSGWTVCLLGQALRELAECLNGSCYESLQIRLKDMAKRVEADFRRYILIDGIVAGFILFDEDFKESQALLHPSDTLTGIHHRLIPMTRSIIAELLTPEEAQNQIDSIHTHLACPDGVRLMDKPAPYRGGVETFFRRAESAAFFGREIGLQYVHAHIRYAEALAMLGHAEDFYKALLTICPVQLEATVTNALPRQSNHYFSSSDSDVLNRKKAADQFDQIRSGDIGAKGGWRVYSSGPGIYIGLVINKFLGLRESVDSCNFDPVLPLSLNGLTVSFIICDFPVNVTYQIEERVYGSVAIEVGGKTVPARRTQNRYRQGGLLVDKGVLKSMIKEHGCEIVVKM
ncbi:MAG: hypothetical protein ABF322_05965 [Lentimonas sp.]